MCGVQTCALPIYYEDAAAAAAAEVADDDDDEAAIQAETDEIGVRAHASLSMPIGAGREALAEADRLLKKYDNDDG